jgi:protein farnesyltransferase subunit beta
MIQDMESFVQQAQVQELCSSQPLQLELLKQKHKDYLLSYLNSTLSASFTTLDASRPWILYWILQGLDCLEHSLDVTLKQRIIQTLLSFQNDTGGFGGGPQQASHLAPTFASVMALCCVDPQALQQINKPALQSFLLSLKQPDGSFCMHYVSFYSRFSSNRWEKWMFVALIVPFPLHLY